MRKIAIIGSGNLASHLCQLFSSQPNVELALYGRNKERARQIATKYSVKQLASIHEVQKEFDFIFLAVSDSAIAEIATEIQSLDGMLLHCAASVSLSTIAKHHLNAGVFYPLQSFSAEKSINWELVPLFIEASTPEGYQQVANLCADFHLLHSPLNSEQRLKLHVAAVFAANFSNLMYQISTELCQEAGLDFALLQPLIEETALKLRSISAREAQTGPAHRNDSDTLQKHQALLSEHPSYQQLYKALSEAIQVLKNS